MCSIQPSTKDDLLMTVFKGAGSNQRISSYKVNFLAAKNVLKQPRYLRQIHRSPQSQAT